MPWLAYGVRGDCLPVHLLEFRGNRSVQPHVPTSIVLRERDRSNRASMDRCIGSPLGHRFDETSQVVTQATDLILAAARMAHG
jgi:hypothetical protein